ncbi:hypothetical protein A5647_16590 [Mycobacterium sp. 1100029.7]|nr:hypothetical protein A5647_16590 [Mycobacterium sp. 1100029.7]
MGNIGEAVLLGKSACEVFDFVCREADRAPTLSAQQVMAVLGTGTQPKQHLTVFGTLGFGDLQVGEQVQNAVYGHQSDLDAMALTQIVVETLCTTEVVAVVQQVEYCSLLSGQPAPA